LKKLFLILLVVAVVTSFGIAAAGGPPGRDGNPPNQGKPTNPPCDADHGHPLENLMNKAMGRNADRCPEGGGNGSPSPSPSPTNGNGAEPECTGFVALADNVIIEDSAPLIDGVVGVHADLLPGADPQVSLLRVCVGLGSLAALGVDCEGPLAIEPDGTSGLLICVEV
jgi:hypothetical protein